MAIGSEGSTAPRPRRRPGAANAAPKPKGRITATGTSPSRTSASARVRSSARRASRAAARPGRSQRPQRGLVLERLQRQPRRLCSELVLVDDRDPHGARARAVGCCPNTSAKIEKNAIGSTNVIAWATRSRRRLMRPMRSSVRDHSRSSLPVRWRKTECRLGRFTATSRTPRPAAAARAAAAPGSSAADVARPRARMRVAVVVGREARERAARQALDRERRPRRRSPTVRATSSWSVPAATTRAVVDDHDPVAAALGLLELVRGEEQRGPALAQRGQHLVDPLAALRVDADGGLVEQHDRGSWSTPHAMLSRRFMPPEKRFTGSRPRSASPVHSSAHATRSRSAGRASPWRRPNTSRFSRAVSSG